MKYLEGGSIGAVKQGGLKAEAAETVTRRHRDEWSVDLCPPMSVSNDDVKGQASDNDNLD